MVVSLYFECGSFISPTHKYYSVFSGFVLQLFPPSQDVSDEVVASLELLLMLFRHQKFCLLRKERFLFPSLPK